MKGRGVPWARLLSLAGLAVGFLTCLSAVAPTAERPYYEGKTIKIMVTSSAGGGTDMSARLAARFLPKYLPGNPKTLVQNMPGAGGTVANNLFAAEAKADGLTLIQDASSSLGTFIRGGPLIKYDPRSYRTIGAIPRGGTILMMRKDAKPRLLERKAKPVVVGDTDGIRTWIAMTVWGAEYLGWNSRWIYGYPGTSELALALRQGEIEMWGTGNEKLVHDLTKEGLVEVLAQLDVKRRADFPQVPTFEELLGAKKPSGAAWQAYMAWAGPSLVDKFLAAPAGTADPIVKILRDAFVKMGEDPEFKAQGNKFFGDVWRVMPGDETEALIREVTTVPEEALDFLAKIRKKYGLPVGEEGKR